MEAIQEGKIRVLNRVYVYSFPVRIFHWLNALAITVLAITGFLIGRPVAFMTSHEAYQGYWFGIVRFTHFTAGYIFLFNFLFRLYFMFTGTKYERWYYFVPFRKHYWKELLNVIKHDILFISKKPVVSIGHNALAGLSYFILFIAMIGSIITGFGLYSQMSDSFIASLFAWVDPALGGDAMARNIHHILMWVFVAFTIIHVYLVFYHDVVERRGETSSMISGWKFMEQKILDDKSATDFEKH